VNYEVVTYIASAVVFQLLYLSGEPHHVRMFVLGEVAPGSTSLMILEDLRRGPEDLP